MNESAEQHFFTLLKALEPYADEYVLIGGWVPWLYKRYGDLNWGGRLSGTTELDIVVKPVIEAGLRLPLSEILKRNELEPVDGATHSAIWVHKRDQTDAIELFTPWAGPAKGAHTVRVEGQPGIDALALQKLELVREFVIMLEIPTSPGTVSVKVPTLGAYLATKALTFTARSVGSITPSATTKRGKDLLYIFDVMSAGQMVHQRIVDDLQHIVTLGAPFLGSMRNAANNLTLITGKRPHPALAEAARALSERDSKSLAVAESLIKGATADFLELLAEAMEPVKPDRPRAAASDRIDED